MTLSNLMLCSATIININSTVVEGTQECIYCNWLLSESVIVMNYIRQIYAHIGKYLNCVNRML